MHQEGKGRSVRSKRRKGCLRIRAFWSLITVSKKVDGLYTHEFDSRRLNSFTNLAEIS
jgi:hypothetical protein